MKELTKRENDILQFIKTYIKNNGYSPSICDIKKGVYISSTDMIQRYLLSIEEKGYIKLTPKISRSIVLKRVL